jgi:hypothetical protein
MPKRNHPKTPQQTPDLKPDGIHEDVNPVGMLDALIATGMLVEDALDLLAETDPTLAQDAFIKWGNGREIDSDICLAGRKWVQWLPPNMKLNSHLDLKGCVNLIRLPKNLQMLHFGEITLSGCNQLDRIIPKDMKMHLYSLIFTEIGTYRWFDHPK